MVSLTDAHLEEDFTIRGKHQFHAERRLLASQSRPPNPEWERFAVYLDELSVMIVESGNSVLQAETLGHVAAIARRIARGEK